MPLTATEHYVTLFDQGYLPQGMCLHQSLMTHAQPFRLWILCMDEEVEASLKKLALPNVSLIPLNEVESSRLLAVKPGRSRGEYCWTLTPFTPEFVFARSADVKRVTYLDADLFFFSSPHKIFAELEAAQKDVLITEHAYDPKYDQTATSGRFCVQFMTFNRTAGGQKVMHWWQERCLEWCFARHEDGKFGDQKYLDDWPERFAKEVHVLADKSAALGPWNARMRFDGAKLPVFYHFHGLKLESATRLRLFDGYIIGQAKSLYSEYGKTMGGIVLKMRNVALRTRVQPRAAGPKRRLIDIAKKLRGTTATADLNQA